MNWFKIENWSTPKLLLIVIAIILLVPMLYTLPAITGVDFSNTGEIGDTIGGLTAPFINGLSAILVFIAFKAQIAANNQLVDSNKLLKEANDLLIEQERTRALDAEEASIFNQISLIQNFPSDDSQTFNSLINRVQGFREQRTAQITSLLNRGLYIMFEFELTLSRVLRFEGNKSFLYRKLRLLYSVIYQPNIDLFNQAKASVATHPDYLSDITEFIRLRNLLNEHFADPTRFDTERNPNV